MTIEQTVEIPADHRLVLDVPREIPPGKAVVAFTPVPADAGQRSEPSVAQPARRRTPAEAIEYCRGLARRLGVTATSDDFLEQRRRDREQEDRQYLRLHPKAAWK
jgi:hypothetical protein